MRESIGALHVIDPRVANARQYVMRLARDVQHPVRVADRVFMGAHAEVMAICGERFQAVPQRLGDSLRGGHGAKAAGAALQAALKR